MRKHMLGAQQYTGSLTMLLINNVYVFETALLPDLNHPFPTAVPSSISDSDSVYCHIFAKEHGKIQNTMLRSQC